MNTSTLLWLIKNFNRRPNIRQFKIICKYLTYTLKSLLLTGLTLDEINE